MKIKFTPKITTLWNEWEEYSVFDLKNETMFFSCTPQFIYENSNCPITQSILDALIWNGVFSLNDANIVIDTRVNMLMVGQYPSIPGWHCDDVLRGENGQPCFEKRSSDVQHYMILLSGKPSTIIYETNDHESRTEFVVGPREYNLDPNNVWNSLDKCVESDNTVEVRKIKFGEMIQFNQDAIHRATPAQSNGWRYFFRLSVTHRKPANEIRRQTQVYCDINNPGW